jgi:hypothetical protein
MGDWTRYAIAEDLRNQKGKILRQDIRTRCDEVMNDTKQII